MPADERHAIRRELPFPPPPKERDDREEWAPRRLRRDFLPHRASLILGLGIVGYFVAWLGLGFVTALPAWLMANRDLRLINQGEMDPRGQAATRRARRVAATATLISIPAGFVFLLLQFGHFLF